MMDDAVNRFFANRNLSPKCYFDALEIIRKEWLIDYRISASARNVKVEFPFYGLEVYGETADKAIKEAVDAFVSLIIE